MPSEAVHAKDFFTCAVVNEISADLKLASQSDSTATMVKHLLSAFAKMLLTLRPIVYDVNTSSLSFFLGNSNRQWMI